MIANALGSSGSDTSSDSGSDTSSKASSAPACPAIFDECQKKGLCYQFQRGNCKYGDKCKYKHDACTTAKPKGFVKEKKGKGRDKGKRGGSRTPGKPDPRSPEEKAKIPCRHFAKGNCTKGEQCPYKH